MTSLTVSHGVGVGNPAHLTHASPHVWRWHIEAWGRGGGGGGGAYILVMKMRLQSITPGSPHTSQKWLV